MTELARAGAGELAQRIRQGELSSLELTRSCLDRIERLDPAISAFITVNPEAPTEAAEADRRLRNGQAGPLTGIPVAVKDNLNTAGLQTTCGSRFLDGFIPQRDATAVERLRASGCVILGKTNLDEFAMGSSTENSAFGPTRNPWDHRRVPGGSSGGSAAAVAAGLAPLALGSDTGGSIRQPAAFCGVVGLKPTYGRVSRQGLVAFGSSLDQVGPLARSVSDAALLLEIIAGKDPADATCSTHPVSSYSAACAAGVAGLRVGWPREYFDDGLDAEVAHAVRGAAEALVIAGATLEEISLPHTRWSVPTYYLVATAEASSNLARFDGIRYGTRADGSDVGLTDLTTMYRHTRARGFGAEVQRRIMLGTYALSAGYYDQFYGKAQAVRALVRRDFVEAFATGIDLMLTPPAPTPAFLVGDKVDDPLSMYLSDVYTTTANLAGLPGLVVPLGLGSTGLPLGAQLIGPDFEEACLFRAGAVLERAFPMPPAPDPA